MGLLLHQQLETDRTLVTPLASEIAQGMIDRDGTLLEKESRLRFPQPFQVPPMMDDFLPAVIQRLQYQPEQVGWWDWLFFDKATRNVLGSIGVGGPPDEAGGVGMAYSVYSHYENQRYTKEAALAVTDWILAQPGAKSLRMTIHPKNYAAVRIAQHAQFDLKGTVVDPTVGEVHLYEANG